MPDNPDLSPELLQRVAQLEALASPQRLEIFRLLVEQEPVGMVSGDIAAAMGQPANAVSFHLKSLQYAGLVAVQREGRYQRYRAQMPEIRGLLAYLTDNCCSGTQSCTP